METQPKFVCLEQGKSEAGENINCDSLLSSIETRTLIWASLSTCSNMLMNKSIAPQQRGQMFDPLAHAFG